MYTQSAYSFDIATFLDLEIGSFYRKIPLLLQYRSDVPRNLGLYKLCPA